MDSANVPSAIIIYCTMVMIIAKYMLEIDNYMLEMDKKRFCCAKKPRFWAHFLNVDVKTILTLEIRLMQILDYRFVTFGSYYDHFLYHVGPILNRFLYTLNF